MKSLTIISIILFSVSNLLAQKDCKFMRTANDLYKSISVRPTDLNYKDFRNGCNVNDSIKQRLIYLLKNPIWTKSEIDSAMQKNLNWYQEWFEFDAKVKKLSRGEDSLVSYATDSVNKLLREERIKLMEKDHYFDVTANQVKVVATLGFKQVIPFLQQVYKEQNKYYKMWAVELALARLGDKTMLKKIFSECKPNIEFSNFDIAFDRLVFINSQEAYYQFNYWIDTVHLYSENSKMYKMAGYVINNLYQVIENKDFKNLVRNYDIPTELPPKVIIKCKEWLKKNKGKYIINRNRTY